MGLIKSASLFMNGLPRYGCNRIERRGRANQGDRGEMKRRAGENTTLRQDASLLSGDLQLYFDNGIRKLKKQQTRGKIHDDAGQN